MGVSAVAMMTLGSTFLCDLLAADTNNGTVIVIETTILAHTPMT